MKRNGPLFLQQIELLRIRSTQYFVSPLVYGSLFSFSLLIVYSHNLIFYAKILKLLLQKLWNAVWSIYMMC